MALFGQRFRGLEARRELREAAGAGGQLTRIAPVVAPPQPGQFQATRNRGIQAKRRQTILDFQIRRQRDMDETNRIRQTAQDALSEERLRFGRNQARLKGATGLIAQGFTPESAQQFTDSALLDPTTPGGLQGENGFASNGQARGLTLRPEVVQEREFERRSQEQKFALGEAQLEREGRRITQEEATQDLKEREFALDERRVAATEARGIKTPKAIIPSPDATIGFLNTSGINTIGSGDEVINAKGIVTKPATGALIDSTGEITPLGLSVHGMTEVIAKQNPQLSAQDAAFTAASLAGIQPLIGGPPAAQGPVSPAARRGLNVDVIDTREATPPSSASGIGITEFAVGGKGDVEPVVSEVPEITTPAQKPAAEVKASKRPKRRLGKLGGAQREVEKKLKRVLTRDERSDLGKLLEQGVTVEDILETL